MSVEKLVHRTVDGVSVFIPLSERKAWEAAADNLMIYSPIVVPDGWDNVFRKDANPFRERLSFFMGPKGVGKSTLLHLKRALVDGLVADFPSPSNTTCLPSADERLTYYGGRGQSIVINENSVGRAVFSELAPWIVLWRLLLGTFVIEADFDRRRRAQSSVARGDSEGSGDDAPTTLVVPQTLLDLFGCTSQRMSSSSVCRYLSKAINSGMRLHELEQLYQAELVPLLTRYIEPVRYCMFVDAVDEHLLGESGHLVNVVQWRWLQVQSEKSAAALESGDDTKSEASYNIWANAQAGLMLAADDLFEETNHRIRVYATIRSEAVHAATSRGGLAPAQLNAICAHVTYSRNKLATIVRLNVAIDLEQHSSVRYFDNYAAITAEKLTSAVQSFFGGTDSFLAYGAFERKWTDEVVRYSMERPRELMLIGKKIGRGQRPSLGSAGADEIIATIEAALEDVLNQFLDYVVGSDVADQFRQRVFRHIPATVLTLVQLEEIEKLVKADHCLLDHPMCKLYSLGLLGHVFQVNETKNSIQEFGFRMAGNTNLVTHEIRLPRRSEVFLLHPVLAAPLARGVASLTYLPRHRVVFDRNENCPIGSELPWSPSSVPRRDLVVHLRKWPQPSTVSISGTIVIGLRGKQVAKMYARRKREQRVAKAGTRPYCFVIAWLSALSKHKATEITLERLQMQFKDLVDEGYLPYRLSGTKTSTLAITVFTTFCGDLSSSDDQLIDVRRFFEFKGFDEPIKYSKARKSATDANEVITLFTHSLRGQDIKVVTDSSPIST